MKFEARRTTPACSSGATSRKNIACSHVRVHARVSACVRVRMCVRACVRATAHSCPASPPDDQLQLPTAARLTRHKSVPHSLPLSVPPCLPASLPPSSLRTVPSSLSATGAADSDNPSSSHASQHAADVQHGRGTLAQQKVPSTGSAPGARAGSCASQDSQDRGVGRGHSWWVKRVGAACAGLRTAPGWQAPDAPTCSRTHPRPSLRTASPPRIHAQLGHHGNTHLAELHPLPRRAGPLQE